MKLKDRPLLVLACSALLVVACGSPKKPPAAAAKPAAATSTFGVIPVPRDITEGKGVMRLDGGTAIVYSGGEPAKQTAAYFIDLMNRQRDSGLASAQEGAPRSGAVNFVLDASKQDLGAEGY